MLGLLQIISAHNPASGALYTSVENESLDKNRVFYHSPGVTYQTRKGTSGMPLLMFCTFLHVQPGRGQSCQGLLGSCRCGFRLCDPSFISAPLKVAIVRLKSPYGRFPQVGEIHR